jgi:hypothetical protein
MTEPDNTAVIDRELAAVDAALESGATTATDPYELELQELALALADEKPRPSAPFAAELGRRVGDGFPRASRFALPSVPKPVLAGAASMIAALAVATALLVSDGSDEQLADGKAAGDAAPSSAAADTGGTVQLAAPAPERDSAIEPQSRSRFLPTRRQRIERSAALTLAAPGDELEKVGDQITAVTDRYDGFVLRSNLTTGDEDTTGGSFELRIPAARLQAALADLAKLADVRSRSQAGEDVTPQFASASDRLQAARAERRSLLRRLENATTDAQVEALRRRLDANAIEIRDLRGQIRDLRLRTDYAKVTVTLESGKGGSAAPGGSGSDDGLGGALDDALGSLGDSVEILIRVLGVALPLGLLLGAGALGARVLRRRRREAALG